MYVINSLFIKEGASAKFYGVNMQVPVWSGTVFQLSDLNSCKWCDNFQYDP